MFEIPEEEQRVFDQDKHLREFIDRHRSVFPRAVKWGFSRPYIDGYRVVVRLNNGSEATSSFSFDMGSDIVSLVYEAMRLAYSYAGGFVLDVPFRIGRRAPKRGMTVEQLQAREPWRRRHQGRA